MHRLNGLTHMSRPSIEEVISIDARDHHMGQVEALGRLCDPLGFLGIERRGTSSAHRAEATRSSAILAHDHKGRRTILKALGEIWTFRLFADGVQLSAPHQPLHRSDLSAFSDLSFEEARKSKR